MGHGETRPPDDGPGAPVEGAALPGHDASTDAADHAPSEVAPPPSGVQQPSAADAEAALAEDVVAEMAEAQAELSRLREQLLRVAADFDNFRKRARKEVDDAVRRGRESLLKELLPVFDNLERAALHAESASDTRSLVEGLRMVLKLFADTLERAGITRVASLGAPFDPSVHEAIQQVESEDKPAGIVMAEVVPGYIMGDRLIRAAMVVVSKGPAEGEASPS